MTGDVSDLAGRARAIRTATPPASWEAVTARPVELLRLGKKARYFHEAGLHTLGDLMASGVVGRIRAILGIGPKTARLVSERLADISDSAAENGGEPYWDRVAA